MNTMIHRHQAMSAKEETRGWTNCVTPAACAADPQRQDRHGNVTYTDYCRCGAIRLSESNSGGVNYGPWTEPVDAG